MSINRHSPYFFKHDKVAKNRVVVPPMASQTASSDGFATEATIAHYKKLAESGAGIIFVEYSFVHPSGKSESNQLGANSDQQISGLKEIANTIQSSGALSGLQLVHAGGKTTADLVQRAPMALSVPVKDWTPDPPQAMSVEEITQWQEWFLQAALRAAAAGFDFVELHAAHGYGLNQWLSPLTNQRADDYAGSITARARLLLEIVKMIKDHVPQLLVAVRLPAQDHLPGGLLLPEMKIVVQQLESFRVDLVDVSSGIGGWRRPEGRKGQGYLVPDATDLKMATDLPVIGVGGIESGDFIDALLIEEKVDFAAVGRSILKNPLGWQLNNLRDDFTNHSN